MNHHKTYVSTFLLAISISPSYDHNQRSVAMVRTLPEQQQQHRNATSSPLALLNQGNETSEHFKKLIADFSDVPHGEKYVLLQKALYNIKKFSYTQFDMTDEADEMITG